MDQEQLDFRSEKLEPLIVYNTAADLPKYRSREEFGAVKIHTIVPASTGPEGDAIITPAESGIPPFRVDAQFVAIHKPQAGGYYVISSDGYFDSYRYLSAKEFENGYERIP